MKVFAANYSESNPVSFYRLGFTKTESLDRKPTGGKANCPSHYWTNSTAMSHLFDTDYEVIRPYTQLNISSILIERLISVRNDWSHK